jgi:hypothetical protein
MLCLAGLSIIPPARRRIAAAVVTVVKPERFLRRLFQTVHGNRSEPGAEGHLYRFPQLCSNPSRDLCAFADEIIKWTHTK